MSKTPENRRQYERLPKHFRVDVSRLAFPLQAQSTHTTAAADISAGGLRVETSQAMEVGDLVQVRVYIPSLNKFHPGFMKGLESDLNQYLQAIAQVAWVEAVVPGSSYTLGLRFSDVDGDDWRALKSLLDKHLTKAREG